MSLAIFILPEESFANEIILWKERVESKLPKQPYTVHPPHMTFLNLEVRNEDDGIAAISSLSDSINPFEIIVNRTNVFWDDPSTGGHTIFFGIEKNDNLFALQKLLANALKEIKKRVALPNYLKGSEQLVKSYNKYGFPFVGDHWIPHFSVSSLRSEKTYPIIEYFLSTTKKYHFIVNQISIWRVDGDKHTQLETIDFH